MGEREGHRPRVELLAEPAELSGVLAPGERLGADVCGGCHHHHPLWASRCGCGISSTLIPTMASPRPRETLAMTSGSSWKVVALTIASARWAGLPDLKMPEPTKTPSAPSCIIIAASAGVAMPPAVKSTTGSLPASATSRTSSYGAASSFAATYSSSGLIELRRRISERVLRMWVVALETSPVPASPLERIIAAPSLRRRSASARLVAPQTNGTVKAH